MKRFKNFNLKILRVIIISILFLSSFSISNAQDKNIKGLESNRVRMWIAKDEPLVDSYFWGDFGFKDMGDGSVRLRPIVNGTVGEANQLPSNLYLDFSFEVKFTDNQGHVYYSKYFWLGSKVKDFITEVGNVKLRYGLDKFQIILTQGEASKNLISISGPIQANIDSYNYAQGVSESRAKQYGFRVERDGLYSEYMNQVKVSDGVYKIEHPSFNFRVFDIVNGNIQIGNENSSNSQKFTFQYDNNKKAYKIRTSDNKLVTWTSGANYNVIAYPDGGHADQYWYLERGGSNRYKIVSAHNTDRLLNIDSNDTNISAAQRHGGLVQEFDLRRN